MVHHRLEQSQSSPHSCHTSGQSHWGGVETSSRTRRSRFLGRVAVAYVQSSLKGGGALCVRRVSNTRLRPVPLFNMETPMNATRTILSLAVCAAALAAVPAAAQVDAQFCSRRDITEAAAKLTRDWAERYQQSPIDQILRPGWSASGKVVQSTKSEVLCRIEFNNVTATYPSRRLELRDVDFRFTVASGQPNLEPISLPMSGIDMRSAILAVWEKLFFDYKSYRSILEEKAEQDPALAKAIGELVGRPKGAETATWEPDKFCTAVRAEGAAAAIIDWAERTNQVKSTGLTSKETPSWLPATGWKIANPRTVSSIPFQSVICSADVSYTATKFDGTIFSMEIRGMPYKVSKSDDGAQIFVETHNWPSEQQSEKGDDAFNRAWVVNGRTFEQDWAAKKQQSAGQPKNIIEAMSQLQAANNQQAEAYAKSQGIDVEAFKRAEAEKTRKYAEPCRRSGGTWGRPTDQYGNATGQLGCYHPTGGR